MTLIIILVAVFTLICLVPNKITTKCSKCGQDGVCPVKIDNSGPGVMSVKSKELLMCGRVKKQLEALGKFKIKE